MCSLAAAAAPACRVQRHDGGGIVSGTVPVTLPILSGNRNERTPVLLPIAGAERVPRSPVILHSCSEWLLHGFAKSGWNSSHAAK